MKQEDFMERRALMKELRVRWRLGLHEDDQGNATDGGIWFPDSLETRRDLTIIVEEGTGRIRLADERDGTPGFFAKAE